MLSVCDASSFYMTSYFLGNVFGTCLYGALTVQLYRYYISFPKDRKPFKVVIYTVYLAEMIYTAFLVYDFGTTIYNSNIHLSFDLVNPVKNSLVTNFHHWHVCGSQVRVSLMLVVCGGIVEFLTQSIYAYRIRIVTKLKCTPWVIILVMVSRLFAVIITVSLLPTPTTFSVITLVWMSVSLTIDVTITSIMVWALKKDEIYSKQLKAGVARLIYLIIGTGFITAATNLCVLVLLSFGYSGYTIGLSIILPKLYANSMMVLINSRIPSARSEPNHRATFDMITVRQSTFRVTSPAGTEVEHGQREISFDPEARGAGSSAHEAEDTTNSGELDSLTA